MKEEGTMNDPQRHRELLTIWAACARASVSRRTIYSWMADGKLKYVRTHGGAVRIYADTLFAGPGAPPRTQTRHLETGVPE
jgi:excisionase family DNA binding protein